MLEINPEIFKKNLLLTQLYCDIQENNIFSGLKKAIRKTTQNEYLKI